MSFAEAARRRDFTINAILKDALTGEIVDVYGGQNDIENKILRVVSRETFAEDSLASAAGGAVCGAFRVCD